MVNKEENIAYTICQAHHHPKNAYPLACVTDKSEIRKVVEHWGRHGSHRPILPDQITQYKEKEGRIFFHAKVGSVWIDYCFKIKKIQIL